MSQLSQTARVLRMLKQSHNGVANYRFPQSGILRYSGRIAELRQEGHNIIAERQVIKGRSTGVWFYHLIEEEQPKPSLFRRIIGL